MRRVWLSLAAVTLLGVGSVFAAEQGPCTEPFAFAVPGHWKSASNINADSTVPQADLAQLVKRMAVYEEIMRNALGDIAGFEAKWDPSAAGALFKDGPVKHDGTAYLFWYYCQNNKLEVEVEGTGQASIHVNSTWPMSGPGANFVIGGKRHFMFASPIGQIRGFPAFQTEYQSNARMTAWVVLVSKSGKAPFHYATRKEFLDQLLENNEQARAKALATNDAVIPLRPKAVQDQDKQKELALFLRGAKDEQQRQHWIERFEKDYRTDEQRREEGRRKRNVNYDKIRDHLNTVRAGYSPQDLEQTAMAPRMTQDLMPYTDFEFKRTKEEVCGKGVCGEYHGRPYALPVRSYYEPIGPFATPHFFTVTYYFSEGFTPEVRAFRAKKRDEFFARFDFDRLVALLGK